MNRHLRIAIASAGRFHILDLARELHRLGHDVKFYSYVPKTRARSFGLPDECHISLLPFAFPALVWQKFAPRTARGARERLLYALLNRALMLRLEPCDVFHAMSGIYLDAACYARRSFGARIWIDRASRHVLSQDEILAAIPGADRPSPLTIRRELAGYSLADRIAVPSYHVMKSFERDVSLGSKLFRNPFGVDLAMFPRRGNVKAAGKDINLIFVGTWSYRKGCDILISVIKRLQNARLVHLGAIGDIQFPSNDRKFIHFDPVVQSRVYQFYQGADVFVLASREEGLSTALIQALAGGLPVICTDRTGGADLAHTPGLAERITVIPHDDAEALTMAVLELHDRLRNGFVFSELSDADRETLSWKEYAKRYCEAISNDERHFARRPP